MPTTPVYSLPFEAPGDQPGHTLDGGSSGTSPILAKAVENALLAQLSSIAALQGQVAALEGRVDALEDGTSGIGWIPIESGDLASVGEFTADLTDGGRFAVGEFALLEVNMRYGLDSAGYAFCQINSDGASSGYLHSSLAYDAEGNLDLTEPAVQSGSWRIGQNSSANTGNLQFRIFHTNGQFAHSFQSVATRMSNSATSMRRSVHWGNVSGLAAAPSSLRFLASAGATQFTSVRYWIAGYRVP